MFMNIFRITGDVCHLLSFVVMFWKLHTSKSVAGISLKTQELYVMVFVARYLDLFWNWLSYYNVVMKIIFIASSVAIVYVIRFGVPHKDTYNAEDDAFPYMYLIVPAALLGVAINQDYSSPFEMCWAFSIYLEAVAILPQLFMLQKQGGSENLTSHYIFLLGMYRLFYLFNWVYRYATEDSYMQPIVWVSGIVQTALYLDFFYTYVNAKRERIDAPIELPA
jgi:ER lumen protein retaining receptor